MVKVPARRFSLAALTMLCLGCETQPTHEVLAVTDLTPRQVEVGDRVRIRGSGFPLPGDIRRVHVTLAGALARPGVTACARPVSVTLSDPAEEGVVLDPITGVEHDAVYAATTMHTLRVTGGDTIEFVMTEELLRQLTTCPGERASDQVAHATLAFVGLHAGVSVRVETLQGTTLASTHPLRGPRIDTLAPWGRSIEASRAARAEASQALGALGIQLAAAHPTEGGLQVDRVAPRSPADLAGLVDGDVLERIDGVTLLSDGDFRPAPGADVAVLSVRRGDAVEDRPVQVSTFTRAASHDVTATAVLLLVALVLVAFGMSPARGLGDWALARWAPSRDGATERTPWRARLRGVWTSIVTLAARDREAAWLMTAAVATTALAMPFGELVCAMDVDVSALHLAGALASLCVAAVTARVSSTLPTLAATLVAIGRRAAVELAPLGALVAAVVLSGGLRAQGLAAAQDGAPWAWNLFRNPVLLVLGVVHLTALVPLAVDARRTAAPRWLRGAAWGVLVLRAAVASLLLLGGARLPGVELTTQGASVALQMLGAAAFVAKAWMTVVLARVVAGRAVTTTPAVFTALALRHLVPLAVIGVTLVLAGDALALITPSTAWELAATIAPIATFVSVLAGVLLRQSAPTPARVAVPPRP